GGGALEDRTGRGQGGRARSGAITALASSKARGRVRGPPPDTSPPPSGLPRAVTSRRRWKAVVMARKRPAPDYTGALAEPIYLEDHYKLTGGLGQLIQEPDVAAVRKQAAEKMRLLFKPSTTVLYTLRSTCSTIGFGNPYRFNTPSSTPISISNSANDACRKC